MRTLVVLFAIMLALCGCATPPPSPAGKRIAISFDDVPRHPGAFFTPDERSRRLLAELRQARVRQAAFFVTTGNLEQPFGQGGEARTAAYVAAGHVIANHSHTHWHLNATPAADYLADLDRAEAWLRTRPGRRPWFRHPYLDEGWRDKARRDAVRTGLAARGLRNGYVTVDASDWNMEALTTAAVRAGKAIDRRALRDLYVETHVQAANYYDGLARRVLGRSPAHTLLLHETDLAALHIGDLVRALRADGWEIVTNDEAYADPLRDAAPDVPVAQGTITEMLAWEKGLPAPRWYERNDTALATRLFNERVLKERSKPPS